MQFSGDYELTCNFVIWILGVLYSVYCFQTKTATCNLQKLSYDFYKNIYVVDFKTYKDDHGDFSDGWSFTGRKKDVSDIEWCTFDKLLSTFMLYVGSYICILEYLKQKQNWKVTTLLKY